LDFLLTGNSVKTKKATKITLLPFLICKKVGAKPFWFVQHQRKFTQSLFRQNQLPFIVSSLFTEVFLGPELIIHVSTQMPMMTAALIPTWRITFSPSGLMSPPGELALDIESEGTESVNLPLPATTLEGVDA
jgi:hypothetical protein